MEVKVAPGWANQEAVGAGSAFAEIALSMGREAWIQRYAASEFLWPVNANSFLFADAASLPLGRALDLASSEGANAVWFAERVVAAVGRELLIEEAHPVERIVGTGDGPRFAIDCLVGGRGLS
ncbi:hypothetical protein ACLIIZ_11610 [Azonexus caeni]|jgi:hypothetical protein|uniref:hypothetical protein n=1 Tax=Azonexus caeni TaxID=266126 RepID=UPI003A8B08A5